MINNSLKRPVVSFITINYNGLTDTTDLLKSIFSNIRCIDFEVIVVDNNSKNREELTILKGLFPKIIAVRSDINLGYAGGNNLGIDNSNGDYLFFINNDTIVPEDHIKQLIQKFESNSKIGAVSPKIIFNSPENTIQFAGYTPLTPITLRNSLIGYMELNDGRYNDCSETPYCHGAAMMVKREVIDRVGKMFEGFFLYYEELDWSISIRKNGYILIYDPSQTIIHKESNTIGPTSPTKTYYLTRNRLLFAKRNLSTKNKYFSILYQLVIAIPKGFFVFLLKGRYANAKSIIKGTVSFFKL